MIKRSEKVHQESPLMSDQLNDSQELGLVSPKYHYANEIRELFKRDPEIRMTFDEETVTINMEVDNEIKALAIRRLLPTSKEFVDGSVNINVVLKPDRFGGDGYLKKTVCEAFKGNPLADYIYWWEDPEHSNNPYCWVVMTDKIISYPESNLHHIYGDQVQLAEDIASDILPDTTNFIYYCTNNKKRPMPDHNAVPFN